MEDGVHSIECEQVFSVAVLKAFFHVWALGDEQNRRADNKTKTNKALYGLRDSAHNIFIYHCTSMKTTFCVYVVAGGGVVAKFKGCSFTHNAVPVQLKAPTGQSELDSSQTATTFKVCGQQHSCFCQKHKLVFIKCSKFIKTLALCRFYFLFNSLLSLQLQLLFVTLMLPSPLKAVWRFLAVYS